MEYTLPQVTDNLYHIHYVYSCMEYTLPQVTDNLYHIHYIYSCMEYTLPRSLLEFTNSMVKATNWHTCKKLI